MEPRLDHAPCGYLSFDDNGTVRTINQTLLDLLGHERAAVVGRHIDTVLSVSGRIFYQTHLFPLLRMRGQVTEVYINLKQKDGPDIPTLANAARRETEEGGENVCVFLTIRQRREFEAELIHARKQAEEASRAKATFMSTMSHELRTPLNAISGYADLLSAGIRGPITEDQERDLQRIRRASTYLLSLINDVLNFSRLEAEGIALRRARVDLEDALSQAEAMVVTRAEEAGIQLRIESRDDPLFAWADPERLQQVLLNLLTNAVKFTPSGGRITVMSEADDGRVLIHVADTGRGIPADRIATVFDPFVQIDREYTQQSQQGVGLGLSISRELAQRMNGDLTVESTPGQGSVFTLTLPRAPAGDLPPKKEPPPKERLS